MSVKARIRRQGGAAVVTIPPALLKLMQMEVGGELSLSVANGELIARPLKSIRKRYSLKELLSGSAAMTRLNAETAAAREGDPVGRELS